MSEPTEKKPQPNRLAWICVGGLLFLLGVPAWGILAGVLVALVPGSDWPKELALVGFGLPLLFVVCWQYLTGLKSKIGYVVFGGLIVGLGCKGIFEFLVGIAPPG